MKTKIVCIAGRQGVGKSTLGRNLIRKLAINFPDREFDLAALGDAMREDLLAMNPYVTTGGVRLISLVSHYGWDLVKLKYPEVRRLLQEYAARVINSRDQYYWCKRLPKVRKSNHTLIVHDLRRISEARFFVNKYHVLERGCNGNEIKFIWIDGKESLTNSHSSEALTYDTLEHWIKNTDVGLVFPLESLLLRIPTAANEHEALELAYDFLSV